MLSDVPKTSQKKVSCTKSSAVQMHSHKYAEGQTNCRIQKTLIFEVQLTDAVFDNNIYSNIHKSIH